MNYSGLNNKVIAGRWGMLYDSGQPQANIRIESLLNTWKDFADNRGLLELDGFFEKGFYFHGKEGSQLLLPIIFDKNYDFAIITKDAKGLVKDVHKRQPILIDVGRENTWLEHGKILQPPETDLFRISEQKLPKAA